MSDDFQVRSKHPSEIDKGNNTLLCKASKSNIWGNNLLESDWNFFTIQFHYTCGVDVNLDITAKLESKLFESKQIESKELH